MHRAACSRGTPIRKKPGERLSPFAPWPTIHGGRRLPTLKRRRQSSIGPNGIGKGRLLLIWIYFVAGFFLPALPWAPLVSLVTSAIALYRSAPRDEFLMRWWEISRPRASAIIAGRLLRSVAIDTLAVLLANWLRHFF